MRQVYNDTTSLRGGASNTTSLRGIEDAAAISGGYDDITPSLRRLPRRFFQNLLAMTLFFLFSVPALADHQDPIAKTNVNEQSDLFKKSVGDVKGFEGQIEGGKTNAVEGLKNSGNTIFEISGKREGEVQNEIGNLKNIKANDLGDKGAKAASESGIMDEIYIDENKTLYREHKKDAELIANGTKDLLSNLLAKLKELGVDCKQVKGNKEIEPEHRIDIKKEASQDARYDPHFCEELRNKYNCRDEVALRCIRKGKRYGEWQPRTKRFDGHWIYANAMNWGYALKWKVGRWGWHITPYHPTGMDLFFSEVQVDSTWRNDPGAIIADARRLIAQEEKAAIEQISENITFPDNNSGRGVGNTIELGKSQRWRVIWQWYDFHYQYREKYDVCEEWEEDWTERCRLQ